MRDNMESLSTLSVLDKMILVIRKNFTKFEGDCIDLSTQLTKIENMRLARIPEQFILQDLVENNSILIQILNKLHNDKIVKEIKEKIQNL